MSTLAHPTRSSVAPLTLMAAQSWQIREVQEAIREADNGDFATDDQVDCVFAKYGA